jgi:hypothetical protein
MKRFRKTGNYYRLPLRLFDDRNRGDSCAMRTMPVFFSSSLTALIATLATHFHYRTSSPKGYDSNTLQSGLGTPFPFFIPVFSTTKLGPSMDARSAVLLPIESKRLTGRQRGIPAQ